MQGAPDPDYKRIVKGNNPEDPVTLRIAAASKEAIEAGLEQLSPDQKRVLELRASGASYREIAAAMNLSDSLLMSQLHYAQRALVAIL